MPIVEVESPEELEKKLKEASGPVAVEFYMNGCAPCEATAPELEKVAQEHPELTILKVDVEKDEKMSTLGDDWKVAGTPTIYFARRGEDAAPTKCRRGGPCREVMDAEELVLALRKGR